MKEPKQKVVPIWNLEDCDCNHKCFANIVDAFEEAIKMVKECNAELEDKIEMIVDLARSFIERQKNGYGGFYIDEFLWCYQVDFNTGEYEQEEGDAE